MIAKHRDPMFVFEVYSNIQEYSNLTNSSPKKKEINIKKLKNYKALL